MNVRENRMFIKASKEQMDEIAKKFNVTFRTVQMALAFQSNSPSARLLRSYALNHGGKMYRLEEVENPYDHVLTI